MLKLMHSSIVRTVCGKLQLSCILGSDMHAQQNAGPHTVFTCPGWLAASLGEGTSNTGMLCAACRPSPRALPGDPGECCT